LASWGPGNEGSIAMYIGGGVITLILVIILLVLLL
jgi:hypothetical protein